MPNRKRRVPYIDARKVKEFDLILASGSSFLSRAIQDKPQAKLFTKSKYNHVAGIILTEEGTLAVLESLAEGNVISPLSKYCDEAEVKKHKYDFVSHRRYIGYPMKAEQRIAMEKRAHELVGKKYDKWALLIAFPLSLLLKLKNLIFHTEDRWVCSSTWAEIYKAGGIRLSPKSIKATTPGDINKSRMLGDVS